MNDHFDLISVPFSQAIIKGGFELDLMMDELRELESKVPFPILVEFKGKDGKRLAIAPSKGLEYHNWDTDDCVGLLNRIEKFAGCGPRRLSFKSFFVDTEPHNAVEELSRGVQLKRTSLMQLFRSFHKYNSTPEDPKLDIQIRSVPNSALEFLVKCRNLGVLELDFSSIWTRSPDSSSTLIEFPQNVLPSNLRVLRLDFSQAALDVLLLLS